MADGLVVRQQRRYLAGEGCIRLRKVLEHVFVAMQRWAMASSMCETSFLRFCMVAQKALQEDMSRKRP